MSSYAIFRDRGKQYQVREGETVEVELMPDAKPGAKITFGELCLFRNGDDCRVGGPLIQGTSILAEVIGEVKGPKTQAYKFKRRKNYHRKVGHRQKYTSLRVVSIKG